MSWLPKRRLLLLATSGSIALVLSLLLLALASSRAGAPGQGQNPNAIGDFGAAPAFELIDQLERPVNSDMFRDQVVVANFVYTSCTDICPLLSVQMQGLQERLRREGLLGRKVQLLSFTVDPVRDTPAVLRTYAERHRANPDNWRFLTGPEATLRPLIVDGFHLGVQALPPTDTSHGTHNSSATSSEAYEVMHSGRFVLIDRQGRIRAYYDGQAFDSEQIVRDIQALLR